MFCTPKRQLCLLVVLMSMVSAACDRAEHDPVASLRASKPSARFDLAYWAEQQHQTSQAWIDAWSYCQSRSEARHPNCRSIRLVGWVSSPPPGPVTLDDLSNVSRSASGLSDSSSSLLPNGERP